MFDFLILLVFIVFVAIRFYTECYKKCPPGKAMVVYGKTDNNLQEPVIITEGGIYVIPLIQDYAFLSLEPLTIKIDTTKDNLEFSDLLTKDKKKINIKAEFTICISKQKSLLKKAAGHLLGMQEKDIIQLAKDIIFGEIRLDTATLTLEEIYNETISKNCFRHDAISALRNIGMELINIELEEITDSSGYKESQEIKSEPEKTFNDEFKDLAQKEIENKDTEPEKTEPETIIPQKFSYNYNDCVEENVYLEIENVVTKIYEEISLAPNFQIIFPKEVMEKYLASEEFNEQIKNFLEEKTRYTVSSFSFDEIQNNEKEFFNELLKEVNQELNSFELKVNKINLLGLFNVSEYMETLDKEEAEKQNITEENIEPSEQYETTEEITTVESPEESIEQVFSKTVDFQKDTQAQIDDIFASTKKYFEQNGNT